jgi:hypothetical protein
LRGLSTDIFWNSCRWVFGTEFYLSCDDVGLDGKSKDPSVPRDSFSHAQKMRASATYGFGRLMSEKSYSALIGIERVPSHCMAKWL